MNFAELISWPIHFSEMFFLSAAVRTGHHGQDSGEDDDGEDAFGDVAEEGETVVPGFGYGGAEVGTVGGRGADDGAQGEADRRQVGELVEQGMQPAHSKSNKKARAK